MSGDEVRWVDPERRVEFHPACPYCDCIQFEDRMHDGVNSCCGCGKKFNLTRSRKIIYTTTRLSELGEGQG